MRLFLAVDVDDGVRDRAASARAALARADGALAARALRWVEVTRLHLTVRFLGEVSEDVTARIVSACTGDLDLPAFDVVFGQPEWMPSPARPRVLILPVESGADALLALKLAIDRRLPADAPAEEERAFRPHLTLARVRPEWQAKVKASAGVLRDVLGRPAACRIEAARLYQSHLSPRGPDYRPLATMALVGAVGR